MLEFSDLANWRCGRMQLICDLFVFTDHTDSELEDFKACFDLHSKKLSDLKVCPHPQLPLVILCGFRFGCCCSNLPIGYRNVAKMVIKVIAIQSLQRMLRTRSGILNNWKMS